MAEWWYNTSFHKSLRITPFQALYGFQPPMITEGILPDSISPEVKDIMRTRLSTLNNIKENLQLAQDRMKK
jgi:hypothetical protein